MPSFLAKALQRNSLLDKLDIHLARTALQEQLSRAQYLVDPVGFHPSQIGACLRSVFYAWCGVPMDSNPPKPKSMRIFHNGDYFHERMQKYFRDMGILEGQWICKACGKNWNGIAGCCPTCKAPVKAQKFDEIDFKKGWMIGASDGLVHFDGRKIVLELKSMNSHEFSNLKKPKDQHKEQGNCYMWALDVEECAFVYENKDNQEIKIFIEKRDEKLIKMILDRITLFVDSYWKKKILPPRECENANWCPYQRECYITKQTVKKLLEIRERLIQERKAKDAVENVSKGSHKINSAQALLKTSKPHVKGSSGSVDKKPILTHSAKAHIRKHGGVLTK